jgi:hypothetical protein
MLRAALVKSNTDDLGCADTTNATTAAIKEALSDRGLPVSNRARITTAVKTTVTATPIKNRPVGLCQFKAEPTSLRHYLPSFYGRR